MEPILSGILYITFLIIPILGGALFIYDAIRAFLKKQYFLFGLYTMMVIYFSVYLIRHILGGL